MIVAEQSVRARSRWNTAAIGVCVLLVGLSSLACEGLSIEPRRARWERCLVASDDGSLVGGGVQSASVEPAAAEISLYPEAQCNSDEYKFATERRLRLFQHRGLDVRPTVDSLRRYYRRHDLGFRAPEAPVGVELPYLLNSDASGLETAITCAFPEFDRSGEDVGEMKESAEVEAFALTYLLRPVVEFLRVHGVGPAQTTNLVAVAQILRDETSDDNPGAAPIGLAISLPLLAALEAAGDPQSEIWKMLDLPPVFSPTIFIQAPRSITSASPQIDVINDLTAAHEFAHTAGLIHSSARDNLMQPTLVSDYVSCRLALNGEQLRLMAGELDESPGTTSPHSQALRLVEDRKPDPRRQAALKSWLRGRTAATFELVGRMPCRGGVPGQGP